MQRRRRLCWRTPTVSAATGAEIVATANVGCMLQLGAGVRRAGLKARVAHVVDLLDEAYAGEWGEGSCGDQLFVGKRQR